MANPHLDILITANKLLEEDKKSIIKQAFKDVTLVNKVSQIQDLHPTTVGELHFLIHQIQNILIAEYSRYTPLKQELELK